MAPAIILKLPLSHQLKYWKNMYTLGPHTCTLRQGQPQVCHVEFSCIDLFWNWAFSLQLVSSEGLVSSVSSRRQKLSVSFLAVPGYCLWMLWLGICHISCCFSLTSNTEHTSPWVTCLDRSSVACLTHGWIFFRLVFSLLQKQILLSWIDLRYSCCYLSPLFLSKN